MKIFQRKKKSRSVPRPPSAVPDPDRGFYSREPDDLPLSGGSESAAGTQYDRRTSRHNTADQRLKSNRTSDWTLGLLVLRAILIVVLLGGGYLLLRLVLSRAAEPTEKEMLQWERTAEQMDGTLRKDQTETDTAAADAGITALTGKEMENRVEAWNRTERHLRAADALARRQIGDEALLRVGQALQISPQNTAALKRRLEIAMQAGDFSAAVPLCLRLLDQDSTQDDVRMTLLQALYRTEKFSAVIALADYLLERQPDSVPVLEIAAGARLAEGQYDEALTLYKRILPVNPRNVLALQGAARIHRMREEWAKAVPYYQELMQVEPSVEIYGELARCYAHMNEAGKAVIFMGQAASLYGEQPVAMWLRAADFDPIRETVDFRAFADRIVGVETRKAIEEIREREADTTRPDSDLPGGLELPSKPDLQLLKPGE
jgi:tetratricopeptide (TPR) repeat protein